MRKKLAMILVLVLIFVLSGCGDQSDGFKGDVVAYGGDPLMFELACGNGKHYGFVITGETELIWEDRSAFDSWENFIAEYDEWDVFGCSMRVTVVPGEATESADRYVDECVEGWYIAEQITVLDVDESYFETAAKPVIYLYPTETTQVDVRLDFDGALTCTYPAYEDGWRVTATPDGTLTDGRGQSYNYLYWEGISPAEYDFSQGFCVAGSDTAAFLELALEQLGLTRREANEFIVYWLPLMEGNPYNLISFQTQAYTDHAHLTVTPEPDTVIRVFMAWKMLEAPVELEPQQLTAPERHGFTLVEWGGTEITE